MSKKINILAPDQYLFLRFTRKTVEFIAMAAVATKPAQKVGSFRSDKAVLQTLPKSITDLLFAELGAGADELVESSSDHAELNAAAFGRPYKLCAKLAEEIRNFSQTSPDQFWDRALHPLIEHSYEELFS